jgi:hypothetical protein
MAVIKKPKTETPESPTPASHSRRLWALGKDPKSSDTTTNQEFTKEKGRQSPSRSPLRPGELMEKRGRESTGELLGREEFKGVSPTR